MQKTRSQARVSRVQVHTVLKTGGFDGLSEAKLWVFSLGVFSKPFPEPKVFTNEFCALIDQYRFVVQWDKLILLAAYMKNRH